MVSWFSSGIVGVISMTFMRTLWMMYPKYLHDTNSVAATRDGLYTDCSELDISESHVRYNITSLAEASAIAKALNAPVVFKLFLPDHKVRWEKVYEEYKSHIMPQAEVEIKSFGNIFMAGTRTYSDRVRNVTLDDILYPKDNVSYYASFAQFLTPESMNDLIGSSKFAKDTNFISNFESDVIASPIHSNTYVYSYSMQLLGRKLWLWASPDSMEKDIGVISTHTANFHYQGSEKSFFEKTQGLVVSVVEEGDLLVFPNLWGHAVLTQAGPNVMFNLREFTLLPVLWSHPLRTLESILSSLMLYQRGGHNTAKWNRVQSRLYQQREKHYIDDSQWTPPESSCKTRLKELLNK